MADQASHDENSLSSKSDFMALPKEISDMIYEHALVRGKIFVPSVRSKDLNAVGAELNLERDTRGAYIPFKSRDWRDERYPRYHDYESYRYGPPIAAGLLQGVCKHVQSEAEAIFYGVGNLFVLPAGYYRNPPMFRDNRLLYHSPPPIPPFKCVSITFDFRDEEEDLSRRREDIRSQRGFFFPMRDDNDNATNKFSWHFGDEEIIFHIHDSRLDALKEIWSERISVIKQCVGLKYLEIDLEECYCPLGCCRVVEFVLTLIGWFPTETESLKQFNITGVGSVEEAHMLIHIIENEQGDFDDGLAPPVIGLFLADQVTVEGMKFVRIPRLETSQDGLSGPARPPDFEMFDDWDPLMDWSP